MRTRLVVVDHGLDSGIYQIFAHETARLLNEFGRENIAVFDSLEDAKDAPLEIIARQDRAARDNQWQFSFRPDGQIERLKTEFSDLTEDCVETFFV
jgi:hypothetical protein